MHFNMTVILTYSPPMTTDYGYYRTFFFSDLLASDKRRDRRREASALPISMSTKQDSRCTILMHVV